MIRRAIAGLLLTAAAGTAAGCQPRAAGPDAAAATPAAAPPAAAPASPAAVAPGTPLRYQSWNAEEDGDPKTYRVEGLALTFTTGRGEDEARWPVLTLTDAQGRSATARGVEWTRAMADFGVWRLDRGHSEPQVIFGSFSGGAHCCVKLVALTLGAEGWKASEIGDYDASVVPVPQDVDGDGRLELVGGDGVFDYAFAPHAGSLFPPAVYELREGKLTDVSSDPRYRPVFVRYLPDARKACGRRENGACAAYVAAAMRAGQGEEAWAYMLKHHDPAGDWLPTFCQVDEVEGTCPPGREVAFTSFPPALAYFLKKTGYGAPEAADRPPP